MLKFNLGIMIIFEWWLKGFDLIEKRSIIWYMQPLNCLGMISLEILYTIVCRWYIYISREILVLKLNSPTFKLTWILLHTLYKHTHPIPCIPITITVECLTYPTYTLFAMCSNTTWNLSFKIYLSCIPFYFRVNILDCCCCCC